MGHHREQGRFPIPLGGIALARRPVIFGQGEQRRLLIRRASHCTRGSATRVAPVIAMAVDLDEAGQRPWQERGAPVRAARYSSVCRGCRKPLDRGLVWDHLKLWISVREHRHP